MKTKRGKLLIYPLGFLALAPAVFAISGTSLGLGGGGALVTTIAVVAIVSSSERRHHPEEYVHKKMERSHRDLEGAVAALDQGNFFDAAALTGDAWRSARRAARTEGNAAKTPEEEKIAEEAKEQETKVAANSQGLRTEIRDLNKRQKEIAKMWGKVQLAITRASLQGLRKPTSPESEASARKIADASARLREIEKEKKPENVAAEIPAIQQDIEEATEAARTASPETAIALEEATKKLEAAREESRRLTEENKKLKEKLGAVMKSAKKIIDRKRTGAKADRREPEEWQKLFRMQALQKSFQDFKKEMEEFNRVSNKRFNEFASEKREFSSFEARSHHKWFLRAFKDKMVNPITKHLMNIFKTLKILEEDVPELKEHWNTMRYLISRIANYLDNLQKYLPTEALQTLDDIREKRIKLTEEERIARDKKLLTDLREMVRKYMAGSSQRSRDLKKTLTNLDRATNTVIEVYKNLTKKEIPARTKVAA